MDQFPESPALLEAQALLVGGLHIVMAGAVTVHALMTKRDVPAAIGWIGMAWLAPVLGALLYVGFGINRVKRRARRLMGSARSAGAHATGDMSSEDPLERLKAAIGMITGQGIATGKVVAILECGDQAYPQMLAAIEGAKSHVRLATYIFRTDERRPAVHRRAGQSPSKGRQNPRSDRWLWRRIPALFSLSRLAPARRSGGPLPAFDAAVEDAVPGSAPA